MEPTIENAHCVGPSITDKQRAMICKFIYRPERFKVLQKKRALQNNVWITEDLIWEDREKKKKLKDESGKKPRFHRWQLYRHGALLKNS